jgi:hypothetical protein
MRELGHIPERALLTLNALYADDVVQTGKLTGIELEDRSSPDCSDVSRLCTDQPAMHELPPQPIPPHTAIAREAGAAYALGRVVGG